MSSASFSRRSRLTKQRNVGDVAENSYPMETIEEITDETFEPPTGNITRRTKLGDLPFQYISEISQDGFGSMMIDVILAEGGDGDVIKARAPDGGYGWVITGAAFVSCFASGFQLGTFSDMSMELNEHFRTDLSKTGWILLLYNVAGNFFGLLLGSLVQQYGCRAVTSVGAAVGAAGIALSSLLVNIPYLYFTFGFLGGIGSGVMFLTSLVMLQVYFNNKRSLAIGIGTSGLPFGAVAGLLTVNWLIETYGLTGTYLISSGIFLQNFVAALLFRPLESRSCFKDFEYKGFVGDTESVITNEVVQREEIAQLTENTEMTNEEALLDEKDSNSHRNFARKGCCKGVSCSLAFKDKKLAVLVLATLLYHIGAISFYPHYILRIKHSDIDRETGEILKVVLMLSTAISWVAWSVVANFTCVNRVTLYAILTFVGGVCVLTFSFVEHLESFVIYGVIHGILSGGCFSLQPTVLVDVVGVEFIAKTTGLINTVISSSTLIGIPLAGFIHGVTGSYQWPFVLIGSVHTVGGVLLIVLDVLLKRRWKTR